VRAGTREVVLTVRTVTGAASTAGTYNATVVLTDTSAPSGVASLVELFLRVQVDPQVRRDASLNESENSNNGLTYVSGSYCVPWVHAMCIPGHSHHRIRLSLRLLPRAEKERVGW
jgi:hypothetical protein